MIYAGLDVGSRTIKLVTLDSIPWESLVVETGANPLRRCQEILSGRNFQRLVVTGYGRHLVAPVQGGEVVSEIKAFAIGARHLLPDCQGVI
ncbi:3-hydroxyacyl-ACP dehydratase, partial [Chloroflexota bacterium]